MNAAYVNRQLIIRLILLCAGLGLAIAALPNLDATRAIGTASQVDHRQRLSVQLNGW